MRSGDAAGLSGELARLGGIIESQQRAIQELEEKLGSLQCVAERMSCPEETEVPAAGEVGSCTGGAK